MRPELDLGRLLDEASEVPQAHREVPLRAIRAHARKRRTARLSGIGAAVVVALGLSWTLVPAGGKEPSLVGESPMPSAVASSAAPQRTVLTGLAPPALPGGWTVLSYRAGRDVNPPFHVLDSKRQAYVKADHELVAVAPAGNRIAMVDLDTTRNQHRITIRNLNGGQDRTIYESLLTSAVSWSPSGDRLLLTFDAAPKDTPRRDAFAIMDAVTGQLTRHVVDGPATSCGECTFSWYPDGTKVMVGLGKPGHNRGQRFWPRRAMQLYDATTAAPAGTVDLGPLNVVGDPLLSPDAMAAFVRLADEEDRTTYAIIDLATFAVHQIKAYGCAWAGDAMVICRPFGPGDPVTVLDRGGNVTHLIDLPDFHNVNQLGPA